MVKKKHILALLFPLLMAPGLFAQKGGPIKISKDELLKAERVNDILKDIPVECHVTSYLFKFISVPKDEKEKEAVTKIKCVGSEVRVDMQNIFRKARPGDKFSFEKFETACLEKHKKKYQFTIL